MLIRSVVETPHSSWMVDTSIFGVVVGFRVTPLETDERPLYPCTLRCRSNKSPHRGRGPQRNRLEQMFLHIANKVVSLLLNLNRVSLQLTAGNLQNARRVSHYYYGSLVNPTAPLTGSVFLWDKLRGNRSLENFQTLRRWQIARSRHIEYSTWSTIYYCYGGNRSALWPTISSSGHMRNSFFCYAQANIGSLCITSCTFPM